MQGNDSKDYMDSNSYPVWCISNGIVKFSLFLSELNKLSSC